MASLVRDRFYEGLADELRCQDAEQRGIDSRTLLAFDALNRPDRHRWLGLAEAAIEYLDGEAMFKETPRVRGGAVSQHG